MIISIVRVEMDECFGLQPCQIISQNNSCKTNGNTRIFMKKYVAITVHGRVEFITNTRGRIKLLYLPLEQVKL